MSGSHKRTSIKKNFLYQMIYEVMILILPLITSPYISRVIGAEGLGIFSYHYSIAYYFLLFSMLGIKNYGSRVIAQVRDDAGQLDIVFWNLCSLHMAISVIVCVIYTVYVGLQPNEKIYAAIQFIFLLGGVFDISWFYFGIEDFRFVVTRNIIIKLLTIVCIFLFVRGTGDTWVYCLIMAASNLLSQMLLWPPLKKHVHYVQPSICNMKIHLRPLLLLFVPAIAISMYKYMDKIMIGAMSSRIQLGLYENAEKIISIITSIISSFGMVMLPKMSNLIAGGNQESIKQYIYLSMKYVMCLGFALSFGVSAVGKPFALLFWGPSFTESGYLIMGLAITIPFLSFANVIRTQYLIPNEKDREYMSSVFSGAVVNLIVNSLLISNYGAKGAMVGTIAAEATVCIVQAVVVRKEINICVLIRQSFPYFFFGCMMFALVYGLGFICDSGLWTFMLQVFIGACFYCLMCVGYFLRIKDRFVLNLFHSFLRKWIGGKIDDRKL